ncbi:uncharacterized protein LOC105691926 isoform X3 [Athalia rosae]|uniref:uncharacterized protein LOC105691926 isoform X3 n=1 Tax=Athalia rosae TaxID=37344 RepID=UPI0020342E43|nr:uncharacterized protein LOC105691926 isoform X3 [Athalia rosae]
MRCSPFFLALIGFSSICGGVPTDGSPTSDTDSLETVPTSSARKLPSQDVGLPSELAWQAWLVVANKPDAQSSFESATVPRRISPKSVFVAPPLTLPACADGYVADSMGRCIKDTIKIDGYSHLKFVLERLNARFAANKVAFDDSAAVASEQKESAASGPLQVNISLGIDSNWNTESRETTERSSDREENPDSDADKEDPVEISVVQVPPTGNSSEVNGAKTEASLTLYKVVNGTKVHLGDEDKGMYFRVNSSGDIVMSPIREIVVPVAEFLEDRNQTTSFGDVVDYEIPTSLGSLFNVTSVNNITKKVQASLSPTVVLLLSPTKGTTTTASSSSEVPGELDSKPAASVTENSEGKLEAQDGGGFDFLFNGKVIEGRPLDDEEDQKEKEELIEVNEELENTTTETSETSLTTEYPEEEGVDTTDWNDEILAHSEAGMLISAPSGVGTSSSEGGTET